MDNYLFTGYEVILTDTNVVTWANSSEYKLMEHDLESFPQEKANMRTSEDSSEHEIDYHEKNTKVSKTGDYYRLSTIP